MKVLKDSKHGFSLMYSHQSEKYGHYGMFNNPKSLAFKTEDEYDLHTKVVQFIRRFYPEILMTAGVGENQDTKDKRIK